MANIIVSGYKKHPGLYSTVIGVTAVICVVGGYYGYKKVNAPKPSAQPQTVQTSNNTSTAQTTQTSTYNGVYVGEGTANQGLTGATITVSGNKMSGPGVYKGSYLGQSNSVSVNVVGTVSNEGAVKGSFTGSGTIMGQSVKVTGTVSGTIEGNKMSCSWKATAYGTSTSGKINLTKK